MQFFMRLLYPADIDLIMLRLKLKNRFAGFVRECLRSWVRGTEFSYSVPKVRIDDVQPTYKVNIRLDPVRDADIIKFITRFPKDSRCLIVKRFLYAKCVKFPAELWQAPVLLKDEAQPEAVYEESVTEKPVPEVQPEIHTAEVQSELHTESAPEVHTEQVQPELHTEPVPEVQPEVQTEPDDDDDLFRKITESIMRQ